MSPRKARKLAVPESRPISSPSSFASFIWLFVLLAATFLVYRPVWNGGLLWDDEAHVTAEALRSWSGLWRIWTETSVSQQYYPVVGTAFWILGKVSNGTFAYHAANILLHAFSAFLVTVILRRLGVPGAMVAGAVFALHPVFVESVAWISELKNTLSGVFYLGALVTYLRFDESRRRGMYLLALGLFLLALGSKTVTASLPAAILVILWWRRGAIDWRRDAAPLAPFFVLGTAAGLVTAWIEYHNVGAQGSQFDLSVIERLLLAGRVVWFYAATIVWPVNLMFSYPRWVIDAAVWWQYLFIAALAAVVAVFFALRHRTRAPLAASLFFVGTLFPVLGFLNVYPFRFSYVADHFQYLASLGVIAGLAALVVRGAERLRPGVHEAVVATVVAVPLAFATNQYSRTFVDVETLYRETIARNPNSLLAHGNLASRLFEGPAEGWAEATEHARRALQIDPQSVAGHNLVGVGLHRAGRFEEALVELRRAAELDPGMAEVHYNLGLTLFSLNRPDEAAAAYTRSLEIYPHNVKALHNYANVLRGQKRFGEALAAIRKAISIDPDSAEVRLNLADTLQASGDLPGAIAAYQDALGRRPEWGEAWNNLGMALRRSGRSTEARQALETAAQHLPDAPLVFVNLGGVYAETGDGDRAVRAYERALELAPAGPSVAQLHQQLAAILTKLGRKAEAEAHLRKIK